MKLQAEAGQETDVASQAAETQESIMKEAEDKPEYDAALKVLKDLKQKLLETTARVALVQAGLKRKLQGQDKEAAKTGQKLDESRTAVTQNALALAKSMQDMKDADTEISQLLSSTVQKTVMVSRDEFLFEQTQIKAAMSRSRKDIETSKTDEDKSVAEARESKSKAALVKLQSTESSINEPLVKEAGAKVEMARSVKLQDRLTLQLVAATLKLEKNQRFQADRDASTNEQHHLVVQAQSKVAHDQTKLEEVKEVAQKAEFAGAQLTSSEAQPEEYEVMELGSL